MNLSYDDFKNGDLVHRGKINEEFYFNGSTIYKLDSGNFFIRMDYHVLPIVGFFPEIELYKISCKLVLVYVKNHNYTFVEPIKVIESKTVETFEGFEPLFLLHYFDTTIVSQGFSSRFPDQNPSCYLPQIKIHFQQQRY